MEVPKETWVLIKCGEYQLFSNTLTLEVKFYVKRDPYKTSQNNKILQPNNTQIILLQIEKNELLKIWAMIHKYNWRMKMQT